ncbi:hypothetical protein DFH08DRAFT_822210 [Mycena albidolilacea]|uniref:Uncharacterized protein n=1 Tax=Mycena albidolilacea TaxID=1033008 RepID=A0AAD6Z911_9AGAR|nr:hypothetical protein DFH08DRAFT_822210 [Mycena albidolilacea]
MQEGGGHRGSATQDSDGDREDNSEDKLPRPLRSALAGSHSESECKDQSFCWDIAKHSWLCEDEDQPLQALKRCLKSCHATANSVAMLVDGGGESKLSLPPSPGPAPQPIPLLRCPAAGAQFQPANQCSWIHLLGTKWTNLPSARQICLSSARQIHLAVMSKSLQPSPSFHPPASPVVISAGPPNATTDPSKPLQRSQTSSFNAVASSLKLPPTDLGTLYSIKNLQPIGCIIWVARAAGLLLSAVSSTGLSTPPPPADDAPLLPTDDTALGTPPPASFGLPGLLAGLPTMSVGPTAPALPTPSAPIMPATAPIVPAAPAITFDPAALVLAVVQIDQFMAAFKGYSIEDLAAALQNIKK